MQSNGFWHRADARFTIVFQRLQRMYGWAGYGLFWALVETMAQSPALGIRVSDLPNLVRDFGYGAAGQTDAEMLKQAPASLAFFCVEQDIFMSDQEFIWWPPLREHRATQEAKHKTFSEAGRRGALNRWGEKQESPSAKKTTKRGRRKAAIATPEVASQHPESSPEEPGTPLEQHNEHSQAIATLWPGYRRL